ncbi:unnamed protein product [Rotaria sp. Silwood1]|nr:unnamed protein product [Rotaria sp. Silwood1]CAF1497247.1 unnamed protein product [Rotaria sp. Silwood1]CAF3604611.1 unnamed protein product [Rotaria sp. Silwood1]
MHLYQHSARCPVAFRFFLECNTKYWCFVPLHRDEALTENAVYHHRNSTIVSELVEKMGMTPIDSRRVDHYLQHVPKAPTGYAFSYGQVQKQREFFENFVCSDIHQLSYHTIDLYKMAIIAVLPDDRSILLRCMIETFFIIHGGTKLNMICPVGSDVEERYGRPYNMVWCLNLNRLSTTTSTAL